MKLKILNALFVVASVGIIGAIGSAKAADEWFVLGEQTIKSADASVDIKSKGSRWAKDIKKVKLSIEGADVEITNAVLHWDNRRDDKIPNVGTMKSGGETAAADAPAHKARLTGVTVQYKILKEAATATLKVWGFD
jgi:hypothetical protein